MYLENGKISERQCFRIGVLENVALGIVLIPYITANVAGDWHFPSLVIGLIFTGIYATIVYFLSKGFPEGMISYISESLGIFGKIIQVIYILRYAVRGGLIIIFFGSIIQEYMLRSFNMWWLIIPFTLISGYGGNKDIEKRGRLLELLFWWMVVPIILVAVFSISNLDWKAIPEMVIGFPTMGVSSALGKIFMGSYMVLVILSSIELMLFTLVKQKKNSWENALKILIWVLITILVAHILIVAILGREWTGYDSSSVLRVMEASAFPGGTVERLDYPVLAFWIIGVFATVSGYMFYSKELINHIVSKDDCKEKMWSMPVVIVLFVIASYVWSKSTIAKYLTWYLVWIDVAVSVAVPIVVWLIKKGRVKNFLKGTISRKNAKSSIIMLTVLISGIFLTGCSKPKDTVEITKDVNTDYKALSGEQKSLENRDYVVKLNVSSSDLQEGDYSFTFEIADLEGYKGSSEGSLKTKKYECKADGLEDALAGYYKEKERQLDMGHMEDLTLEEKLTKENVEELIKEISEMPQIPKSITVAYKKNGESKKISLREMIKYMYAGEDF